MSIVVNDELLANELLAQRRTSGADRYDEVWEGVYMMSPLADNEHQRLVSELTSAISTAIDWNGLGRTLPGANVSDRRENWTRNYRIPDVLVFLNDTAAVDCGTHYHGGPDFAIELVSRGDRTLEKLDFYAAVGTRELLVIDRDPWQLTLYQANENHKLTPVAISSFTQRTTIHPTTLPLCFSLDPEPSALNIVHSAGQLIRQVRIAPSN
jgi:Uma2 family endonuclease